MTDTKKQTATMVNSRIHRTVAVCLHMTTLRIVACFLNGSFGNVPVGATICPTPDQCPYYHYKDDELTPDNPTAADDTPIHLFIESFRDKVCGRTFHNALTHAKNPKRLSFCVIQQTKSGTGLDDDIGCWEY
jgi:hypothetical protein